MGQVGQHSWDAPLKKFYDRVRSIIGFRVGVARAFQMHNLYALPVPLYTASFRRIHESALALERKALAAIVAAPCEAIPRPVLWSRPTIGVYAAPPPPRYWS